jgi:Uma2 family endonuclease
MATADFGARLPLEVQITPPLLTVAELALFPEDLPCGKLQYELDNGRLMMMSPPADRHGEIQLRIGAELLLQGDKRGYGKSRTEASVILWRGPDRVVVPDVLFLAQELLPLRHSSEGYLETIPSLVVEVRSQNDSLPYLQRKIEDYLRAGVRQVWIADPGSRTITVHRADFLPVSLTDSETLTDALFPLIPGLQIVVAEVFAD